MGGVISNGEISLAGRMLRREGAWEERSGFWFGLSRGRNDVAFFEGYLDFNRHTSECYRKWKSKGKAEV